MKCTLLLYLLTVLLISGFVAAEPEYTQVSATGATRQYFTCTQTISGLSDTTLTTTSSFSCKPIDISRSYSANSAFICTDAESCSYHGSCNRDHTACVCSDGYLTYNNADGPQCNYQQKQQLTAFLLSFFVGWTGADYFYLDQTNFGVLKLLVCGIGGLIVFGVLACVLAACAKNSNGAAFIGIVGYTLLVCEILAGFGWWLAAVIMIGKGTMSDGNGQPMQSW